MADAKRTEATMRSAPASTHVPQAAIQTPDLLATQSPTATSDALATQVDPAPEYETLLKKLLDQARKRKRWSRITTWICYAGASLYLLPILIEYYGRIHLNFPDFADTIIMLYAFAGLAGVLFRRQWGKSIADLTNIDDVRAIGVLAEALEIPDMAIRLQVQAALMRLFPRLRPEDASLLNTLQRRRLYRLLTLKQTLAMPDFLIALLDALEKVGDADALAAVQALENDTDTTVSSRRVQAAAKKCLPILRARVLEKETGSTLLRASSMEEAPASSLLRPARGGHTDTPEQLLRAAAQLPRNSE